MSRFYIETAEFILKLTEFFMICAENILKAVGIFHKWSDYFHVLSKTINNALESFNLVIEEDSA